MSRATSEPWNCGMVFFLSMNGVDADLWDHDWGDGSLSYLSPYLSPPAIPEKAGLMADKVAFYVCFG